MSQDIQEKIEQYTKLFIDLAYPIMQKQLECTQIKIADPLLDRKAGIDVHITIKGVVYDMAIRVHPSGRSYNTFTVRKKGPLSEYFIYEKAFNGLQQLSSAPQLTAEAYVSQDGQRLLSLAVVRTVLMFNLLKNYGIENKRHEFVSIAWDKVRGQGVKVWQPDTSGHLSYTFKRAA